MKFLKCNQVIYYWMQNVMLIKKLNNTTGLKLFGKVIDGFLDNTFAKNHKKLHSQKTHSCKCFKI